MARRRTTRKTTRRRSVKPMLNVTNAAQSLIVANAATTAFFGTNLSNFLLDGWARPATVGAGAAQGYVGGTDNSWELSAAEIVKGLIPNGEGFGFSSQYMANGGGFGTAVMRNLRANPQAIMTMVLTPVAFKVGKKVLQKPLIAPLNKGIKALSLNSLVKV